MKTIKKSIPFIIIFSFIFNLGSFSYDQEIPRDISIAFKVGNAEELARFFNNTIELVILDKEDVYSKLQAQQIIDNFFTDHFPKSFEIIHQGGKEESKFAIGKLVTFNGTFRVYFLLKLKDDQPFIHQLRIEQENE
ncbi:MAG: hypothetical protein A2041_06745 [Bacteroidetes bacterium GWA2_31_9b]|nr:MAG: hypothetical protein A2041_06745 [Bacteroidetes bacterium GWA2_31_9b]